MPLSAGQHLSATYRGTEPIFIVIDSSRPRMAVPTGIIEQIKDYSPHSPTLHIHTRESSISDSWATEGEHKAELRQVCGLATEPPIENTDGRNRATPELIFNNTGQAMMNFQRAPTFDPSEDHTTAFSKLRSLDLLPAIGLAEDEFWSVFSRCRVCLNFMTTRTIPYHICPSSADVNKETGRNLVDTLIFPRLLDAHDVEYSAGVSEETFGAIFYICAACGRYMTRRLSFNHHDDEDFDSPPPPCVYLRKRLEPVGGGTVRPLEDFPPLSPLHTVANED